MDERPTHSLKLFYCYAHEDRAIRDELDIHLSGLKRQNRITSWYDREISPGVEWKREIEIRLDTAHIILLLVSPHFMASDYCFSVEMHRALERHKSGAARVVPILVRPTDWKEAPFSILQVLPMNAVPVTRWDNRDDAFEDVAKGIRRTVMELQAALLPERFRQEEVTIVSDAPSFSIIEGTVKNTREISFQEKSGLVERLLACSSRKLSPQDKFKLVESLLACRSVRGRSTRETILRQLRGQIRNAIEDASRDDVHMTNVVDACLDFSGGIEELVDIVQHYEKDSVPMQDLDELLDEIFPKIVKSTQLRDLKLII